MKGFNDIIEFETMRNVFDRQEPNDHHCKAGFCYEKKAETGNVTSLFSRRKTE